jgi:hypothetical protein
MNERETSLFKLGLLFDISRLKKNIKEYLRNLTLPVEDLIELQKIRKLYLYYAGFNDYFTLYIYKYNEKFIR